MPQPLLRAAYAPHLATLPDPYPALASSRYEIKFLPGQLMMIAGPSGCGKTVLALHLVLQTGRRCLYFSADSDERTMACRAASALTGERLSNTFRAWENRSFNNLYKDVLANSHIKFEFEPTDPTIQDIQHSLDAYYDVAGEWPAFVVIDTLTNTEAGDNNEWSGLRKTAKDLHWLARRTNACIIAVHHTSEQREDFEKIPPPRSAIQGKISQLPSVIMTVTAQGGVLNIGVVKNRFGPSDPAAKNPLRLSIDISRMHIDGSRLLEFVNGREIVT